MTADILPTDEFEHKLLRYHNDRIARAAQIHGAHAAFSSANLLRSYPWQRPEYRDAACKMAAAAEALVLDSIDYQHWLNQRADMNTLAWKLRRMARGRRGRARRQLMEIVTDLRSAWSLGPRVR